MIISSEESTPAVAEFTPNVKHYVIEPYDFIYSTSNNNGLPPIILLFQEHQLTTTTHTEKKRVFLHLISSSVRLNTHTRVCDLNEGPRSPWICIQFAAIIDSLKSMDNTVSPTLSSTLLS